MTIKNYLTVRQVSKQLELTEYRIRQLIREKQIMATKIVHLRIIPDDFGVTEGSASKLENS